MQTEQQIKPPTQSLYVDTAQVSASSSATWLKTSETDLATRFGQFNTVIGCTGFVAGRSIQLKLAAPRSPEG